MRATLADQLSQKERAQAKKQYQFVSLVYLAPDYKGSGGEWKSSET